MVASFNRAGLARQGVGGETRWWSVCLRVVVLVSIALLVHAEFCLAGDPQNEPKSVSEIVETLQQYGLKVKEAPPSEHNIESLAGHYTQRGRDGEGCYLFSDGSYIYTEWGDCEPETIYEKGTWSLEDGFIEVKPDGSLPRIHHLEDHLYAPLLVDDSTDVYLMNRGWHFSRLLDVVNSRTPDTRMLEFYAMRRKGQPSRVDEEVIRQDLMARAWRPEYFGLERPHEWTSTFASWYRALSKSVTVRWATIIAATIMVVIGIEFLTRIPWAGAALAAVCTTLTGGLGAVVVGNTLLLPCQLSPLNLATLSAIGGVIGCLYWIHVYLFVRSSSGLSRAEHLRTCKALLLCGPIVGLLTGVFLCEPITALLVYTLLGLLGGLSLACPCFLMAWLRRKKGPVVGQAPRA